MFRSILAGALLGAQSLWALTGGPAQPEYSGFTPSTKSGSVDLYSGDFSYSIPLLTVPGPSFNYPVVLGYRGGITTDQGSTWVGLGWSLNAGAINRALNKYPDDYQFGTSVNVLQGEDKVYAWDLGVSYMGIGLSVGQRSDHGWHGGLDFSVAGYDIGGIKFDQADGFGMREMTTLTDQFIGKASGASLSALNGGLNDLLGSQQMGLSMAPSAHGLNVSVAGVGFSSSSVASGAFNNVTHGVSIPVLNTGITIDFSTSNTWIHKKEIEELYGYLNLQYFPREVSGTTFETQKHKMEYAWAPDLGLVQKNGNSFESWLFDMVFRQKAFVAPTPDGYQAKAEGMSMSFRPYRQDIGDYYGAERIEAEVGFWLNIVNKTWLAYIPYFERRTKDDKNAYNRELGVNATQFVRDSIGAVANEQEANYATRYRGTPDKYPVAMFRETGTAGGTFLAETWRAPREGTQCTGWECELNYRRRNNNVTGAVGYPDARFPSPPSGGQFPDRISGGNGVFPIYKREYNNAGIDPAVCGTTVNEDIASCDPAVPIKALIGFTLVRPDGMIYEYHKPVFNWTQKTLSVNRPGEPKKQGEYDFGAIANFTIMNRAYATSWLLTAIKAPDYVDLGTAGPDDGDIGSWVSFTYGDRIKTFQWRTPYEGSNPTGIGKNESITDAGGAKKTMTFESYGQVSWGMKEIYYLKNISTPSHTATFFTDPKLMNDGLESANRDLAAFGANYSEIDSWTLSPENGDLLEIQYYPGTIPSTGGCTRGTLTTTQIAVLSANGVTGMTPPDISDTQWLRKNGRRGYNRIKLASAVPSQCPELYSVHRVRRTAANHVLRQLNRIELTKKGTNELLTRVRFTYEARPTMAGVATKELAPGIPDVAIPSAANIAKAGKLTLRQIIVGDGQVELPPYKFNYYMEGDKAPYDRMAWDRWGYYKRNGGWVNTELLKGHVVDWNYFLNALKTPGTDWVKLAFEAAVAKELDAGDLAALKAAANPAAIREGYYRAMVKALNRMRTDLKFYSDNRARITVPNGNNWSDDWLQMAKDSACLNADGSQKPDPNALRGNQKNILHGLNAALLVEALFKPTTTTFAIVRDVSVNTFDHETNPQDVMAWSLKQVTLPSGGKIDVEYESDNFVYVGRTRTMDLVDVDQFKTNGNLDYFRNIGAEKSMTSATSLLKFDQGLLGEKYWLNPSQTKIRVSSLFRVYKKNKAGVWGPTPMFERFRTKPGLKLTLLGWHNDVKVNENIFTGNECGYVEVTPNSVTGPMAGKGFLSPFVLGTVAKDIEIKTGQTDAWYEANQCQRAWVDFDLSRINLSNLEAANRNTACGHVGSPSNPTAPVPLFLERLGYLTLSWARPRDPADLTDWPMFIPLQQGTAIQNGYATYTNYIDLDTRANRPVHPASAEFYYALPTELPPSHPLLNTNFSQRPDIAGKSITFQATPGTGPWLGPGRWDALTEFSPQDASDSWDVMSYAIGRRISGGDPVSMAAGIAGGGLRVKRLSYNTGWPQRAGDPPQTQSTEYSYDCSGANGGVYSSGATASMPPPYSNKGDDRLPLPPEASLVEGSPFVGYRRVTEVRPGRGKIVHDFLTPADLGDFISYENCNGGRIENDVYLGPQAGCYDRDVGLGWVMTGHARWKLNRVSQFQGLMTAKRKYSERKAGGGFDLVAEENFTYMTSLLPSELGNIHLTALLNNSDAVGVGALASNLHKDPKDTDAYPPNNPKPWTNRLFAGSRDYAFTTHPASEHMGKTVERARLRWYFREEQPPNTPRSKIGLNEMEIVEHSLRQWQVVSKVEGVGTRTASSYYDFLTGEPLVSTVTALKQDSEGKDVADASLPVKTTVTVPAHWVGEYNPTAASTLGQPSMGPIHNDPNHYAMATGTRIPSRVGNEIWNKNMLTQTFSQSTYAGLPAYGDHCSENPCTTPWLPLLQGTNILSRNLTTWKRFAQSRGSQPAWRTDETYALRLPMANATNVLVDRGSVAPPLPALSGGTVQATYRDNPAYVLGSQNLKYGDLGEVLETRDAYDARVASFYLGNKLLVGQVVNSDLGSCALLSVDELSTLNGLSPVWNATGGAIATGTARSGSKSIQLNTTGQRLTMTLPSVKHNRNYEFSVWTKDPGRRGFITLRVNGTQAAILPTTYDPAGPEWQRTRLKLPLNVTLPSTVQVTAEVLLQTGTNSGMWIDDLRFVAEDAQAYNITYDFRGNRSSEAGPNDILSRYKYDSAGRLMEVQDHQGVVVSTQAEMEAK